MSASFLALLDDIATMMKPVNAGLAASDDIVAMAKVAGSKTAGVVVDDLAVNADQVNGLPASRELPVVAKVATGSMVNKLVLIPVLLALSTLLPAALPILLIIGGLYLSLEGFEKIREWVFPDGHEEKLIQAAKDVKVDMVAFEKEKIRGAIITDMVLSAEIMLIALGTMAEKTLMMKGLALLLIGVLMTVGVYGIVALLVKADDMGLWLAKRYKAGFLGLIARALMTGTPYIMKMFSVVGTIAMLLVGGELVFEHALVHGPQMISGWFNTNLMPYLHHWAAHKGAGFATGLLSGALVCLLLIDPLHKMKAAKVAH